jgi:hypothetical protein
MSELDEFAFGWIGYVMGSFGCGDGGDGFSYVVGWEFWFFGFSQGDWVRTFFLVGGGF